MSGLLVIDLALVGVMIMVAAVIIVRRGRRLRTSAPSREVAGLAGEKTVLAPMPVVPGFSDGAAGPDPRLNGLHRAAYEPDPEAYEPGLGAREPDPAAREPDPGARESSGPEQEASSQVSGVADAEPGAREPTGQKQEASSQVSDVAGAGPGPHAAVAELNGRPAPDGAVASSGQVYSYYEGADQPMADYLAELGWDEEPSWDEEPGWAEEPGARDPR